ncbi:ABC transporter ATP-binding protein [Histidinibacterium lentulum]|uniref:ABC transporter ATP-binding protein n=1 Tax=Histidinibacterium lentulum TaxID=2480588 RepID=A0A3N2QMA3_9RHOB|nr:ABC transporter ATP-binding protein [Histidinibacterium lentulum]ROT96328.1 ABC transporter ATP-binding protein [Histidinibacterium lentulum]
MKDTQAQPIVEIEDLRVTFPQAEGSVRAVRGVSLALHPGESLGVVGESGSGKSVSWMAVMRLLRAPPAEVEAGRLRLAGIEVMQARREELTELRGRAAAMIFQDPMTAFDPVFTIGHQIIETIRAHRATSKRAARAEALDLLERVEIRNAEAILDSYPHQLSGGMLQRAMIAMALSCRPQVLIADEPTTALDVTVQAQILQLIKDLQDEMGMGLVMITHDLGVVAETVDRVVVMYGGKVMEEAPVVELFEDPRHPYTRALMVSIPGQEGGRRRLTEIPGASPDPSDPPEGCPFHPRCTQADAQCAAEEPPMAVLGPGRRAACWRLT